MGIWEKSKHLKSIADASVIVCDEILNITGSVPTNVTNTIPKNMTNTISANVTSTVLIIFDDKKVRSKMNFYILHTFLLVTILLFLIALIFYHYIEYRSKKHIDTLTI